MAVSESGVKSKQRPRDPASTSSSQLPWPLVGFASDAQRKRLCCP